MKCATLSAGWADHCDRITGVQWTFPLWVAPGPGAEVLGQAASRTEACCPSRPRYAIWIFSIRVVEI